MGQGNIDGDERLPLPPHVRLDQSPISTQHNIPPICWFRLIPAHVSGVKKKKFGNHNQKRYTIYAGGRKDKTIYKSSTKS